MVSIVDRLLNGRGAVYAAGAISLALGLFFTFVWSPLPWGWHGIDFYYEIATSLARGAPFPTMHIPWGYAYFLAFWYRLFGDHQWIPLCAQAALNASIPLLLYHTVRIEIGHRVGVMAAIVAGLFSFNTIYTSTQASDAVCTTLVVAMMLAFAIGRNRQQTTMFVAAGGLAGVAFQFRPNLALLPGFVAALYVIAPPRGVVKLQQMAFFIVVFLAVAAPWVVRNYWWSGLVIPATTHGGVQFWFGTLQAGAYEKSWPRNPRAAFENPPVDYTSVAELPLVLGGRWGCDLGRPERLELVYWTSRDRTPRRMPGRLDADGTVSWVVPRQTAPTALYYYFEGWWVQEGLHLRARTPRNGAEVPLLFVVSRDHLSDLDLDGYVLDIFDVIRLVRHLAWSEPLPLSDRLDLDGNGTITDADVRLAASLLVQPDRSPRTLDSPVMNFVHDDRHAVISFRDGSTLTLPRQSAGALTDIVPAGEMASAIVSRSRAFANLRAADTPSGRPDPLETTACLAVDQPTVNRVPYRRQPHEMRRFVALAVYNIKADPGAYLAASARRALRVFVIEGSDDRTTATQFSQSRRVYLAARAASIAYLLLFIGGLAIAVRRRERLFVLLAPIVYVPATICFMLINARYSMTIQPFMFGVIAVALVRLLDALKELRLTH